MLNSSFFQTSIPEDPYKFYEQWINLPAEDPAQARFIQYYYKQFHQRHELDKYYQQILFVKITENTNLSTYLTTKDLHFEVSLLLDFIQQQSESERKKWVKKLYPNKLNNAELARIVKKSEMSSHSKFIDWTGTNSLENYLQMRYYQGAFHQVYHVYKKEKLPVDKYLARSAYNLQKHKEATQFYSELMKRSTGNTFRNYLDLMVSSAYKYESSDLFTKRLETIPEGRWTDNVYKRYYYRIRSVNRDKAKVVLNKWKKQYPESYSLRSLQRQMAIDKLIKNGSRDTASLALVDWEGFQDSLVLDWQYNNISNIKKQFVPDYYSYFSKDFPLSLEKLPEYQGRSSNQYQNTIYTFYIRYRMKDLLLKKLESNLDLSEDECLFWLESYFLPEFDFYSLRKSLKKIAKAREISTIERAYSFPNFKPRLIQALAKEYKMDAALILAIIHRESFFREKVESRSGAQGLMQLMPRTAAYVYKKYHFDQLFIYDLSDPVLNLHLGLKYYSELEKQFGNRVLALAAYNAGPGRVNEWIKRKSYNNWADEDAGFIISIPYPETRTYVKVILENYLIYQSLLET